MYGFTERVKQVAFGYMMLLGITIVKGTST